MYLKKLRCETEDDFLRVNILECVFESKDVFRVNLFVNKRVSDDG